MSLTTRQITQKIADKTLEFLKRGEVPENTRIFQDLRDFFRRGVGLPTMRFRKQQANDVIDIESFNQSLDEVEFDIKVLYEEVIDHIAQILSRFHFTNQIYNTSSRELDRLITKLDEELFTIKNADDHFQGFIENFDSLDRIDQAKSTPGIVDLAAGELGLPSTSAATLRVEAPHLFSATNWPVTITSGQTIKLNSSMQGAGFGNAFSDTISVWRHQIRTGQSGPLTAFFTFPIAGPAKEEKEVLINRIQITPHSEFPFNIRILKSLDNINYTVIPGHTEFVSIDRQSKTYNFDFPTELIQYIRIEIEKPNADQQIDNSTWEYLFGFFSIGYYSMGRVPNGEMISKPYNTARPIGKVSLSSVASLPRGTDVNYYVALGDTTGGMATPWRPIRAAGTPKNDRAFPEIVKFGDSERRSVEFLAEETGYINSTYKGINIYELNHSGQLTDRPLYGSASLLRGEGSWARDLNPQLENFTSTNVYMDFSATDTQSLYVIEREILTPNSISGSNQLYLNTTHSPYYDPTLGHTLVPNNGINTSYNQAPTYAVYEAKWIRKDEEKSLNVARLGGNHIRLPNGTILDNERRPEVRATRLDISGNVQTLNRLLREDLDYEFRENPPALVALETGSSWWRQQLNSNGILDFNVSYYLEDDLTQKIVDINNKRIVIDSNFATVAAGDNISLRYRRVAKEPDIEILPDTVRVKPIYGVDGLNNPYFEGTDYSLDVQNGTIYRIPNGNIPAEGTVFVDFRYQRSIFNVQTFTAWCEVTRAEMPEINISNLNLNSSAGELFMLNTSKGLIDLSNLGSIPPLGVGWHQFIVKSLDPSASVSAINQVISLIDRQARPIFQTRGTYFSRVFSDREYMRQITPDFLKKGILKDDHRFFAITDDGYILLNFLPGSTDDLYTYRYNSSTGAVSISRERFLLDYAVQTRVAPSSSLLVKVELTRRPSIDGGLSPTVDQYSLRIGP